MEVISTRDSVTIRNAAAADAALMQHFVAQTPPLDTHTAFTYWVHGAYNSNYTFLAECRERIVGLLSAVRTDSATRTVYIWQIGVSAEFRGGGIADMLLEQLVQRLQRDRITSIEVSIAEDNASSRKLFERFAARLDSSLEPTSSLTVEDSIYGFGDHEIVYRIRFPILESDAAVIEGVSLGPVKVFIYGNLLPGQKLSGALEPYILAAKPARTFGQLYWHKNGQFPILVLGGSGSVSGLVVELVSDAEVFSLLAVEEVGYGYEARWIEAFESEGSESLGNVLVFAWPWSHDTYGALIDSGDFTLAHLSKAQ